MLEFFERIVAAGVENGDFHVAEPHEAARALIILCTSLVEPYPEMGRSMAEVITLYQGYARAIACSGG